MADRRAVSAIVRRLHGVDDVEHFLQLLQELVSTGNIVSSRENLGSIGTSRQPQRLASGGECSSPSVCPWVDPALWSTLPDELVEHVFARLPLPKINELRSLSKQWSLRFMTSEYPDFMRACSKAHPKMFGMITQGPLEVGVLTVRLYDTEANRWYSYEKPMAEESFDTMCAGDGGLVCIVSAAVNKKENPLLITVLNPLTRHQRPLPPPPKLREVQPCMVQLVMDDSRECYKVIVVGGVKYSGEHGTHLVAEVYCSETGVWRSVEAEAFPNLIFGYHYQWDSPEEVEFLNLSFDETLLGPCAYDSAGRVIVEFDVPKIPTFKEILCESCALVKDRLFLLHQEIFSTASDRFVTLHRRYVVSEYQCQGPNSEPNWVQVKVHRCAEFQYPAEGGRYRMTLYGCQGFLLLKAANLESLVYEHELTWFCDLSTSKWQKVPAIPYPGDLSQDAMFELRWDAAP